MAIVRTANSGTELISAAEAPVTGISYCLSQYQSFWFEHAT